jgi:MGT family glycosyltransferase
LDLLDEFEPVGVIDDTRTTGGISTQIRNIPRFSITNASGTQFAVNSILDETLAAPPFPWGFGAEEVYNQVRTGYGLEPVNHPLELFAGDLTLMCDIPEYCPMNEELPDNYHFVGPITWGNHLPIPTWIDDIDPDRPTIYLTMGSTGRKEIFQTMIKAFTGTEFQVMMTLDSIIQEEDLQPLPDNFFVSKWAPGKMLASKADVVVCHGGNGTAYQALEAGKPMVTIPVRRDQNWNARRQVELGVSQSISCCDPESLKRWIEEVITNPTYRTQAKHFQTIINQYNAPQMAATLIHNHIQNHLNKEERYLVGEMTL